MPDLWMPDATRIDIGDHQPTDGGEPRAIGHITWDRNATAARPLDLVPYANLQEYFGRNPDGKPKAPTVLWDPFEGRFTQFLPATSRAKALADRAGGTRTNRTGRVCLQVEALFFPYCRYEGVVYPRLVDTPCAGWEELLAWVRSWGVPDVWPMGRPDGFTGRRDEQTWRTRGGWYAHAHVPENDHVDPGSWPAFTATGRNTEMSLVSKTVPQITGDDSATIFTAVPGEAHLNISADYVRGTVTLRLDVSDRADNFVLLGKIFKLGNGGSDSVELPASTARRMVSLKRLDNANARVDATLHYPG